MSHSLSKKIVIFIANLLPLYVGEICNGETCARSLIDGTLILPIAENDGSEEGFVEIRWQGDPLRSTTIKGAYIASIAVTRYVELHAIPVRLETKSEFEHMSKHFNVKTGEWLVLDSSQSEIEIYKWMGKVVDKLGSHAVVELLKKAAGV